MDSNYVVKKSNYFIMNCSYDLSVEEQKIILTLASLVRKDDEDFKSYKFKISEFMEMVGVDTKTKYKDIPEITKELMKKVFEIYDEEDDKTIQTAWLSSATYKKGTGMIELEFSKALRPYMLKLNKYYTSYKLKNILKMKSKYSIRFYEILKCALGENKKEIVINYEELKELLKASNTYSRPYDFKKYVLEKVKSEIKDFTDITFEYEEIKFGRKLESIKFMITHNGVIKSAEDEIAAAAAKKKGKGGKQDDVLLDFSGELIDKTILLFEDMMELSSTVASNVLKNANGDFSKLEKIYKYMKNINEIPNPTGLLINLSENFVEPKSYIKPSNFVNTGNSYDLDNKELLGKIINNS